MMAYLNVRYDGKEVEDPSWSLDIRDWGGK